MQIREQAPVALMGQHITNVNSYVALDWINGCPLGATLLCGIVWVGTALEAGPALKDKSHAAKVSVGTGAPVNAALVHVSWHEARAFCCWAGRRQEKERAGGWSAGYSASRDRARSRVP